MSKVSASSHLYTYNFDKPVYQTHYGIKCRLPTPAPDRECVNWGLPAEKQKFFRTYIPDDLFEWQFMGEDKKLEMEQFIADEYHKRKNGVWIFIKGQKFYIPGVMYYFMNYWVMESGKMPVFKITDLYFFLVWFEIVHNPKIYGLVDFKTRRCGDTEKALCIVYEYGTRVRNTRCGMQSYTEDHIKESFTDRLVYAHDKMIWFMKPINKGSSTPQEGLIFEYPSTINSTKAIEERVLAGKAATTSSDAKYAYPPLKTKIDYKASTAKAYNGKKVGRYYCDEVGMMEEMDPNEAWGLVKQALKDETTDLICGKAIFTGNVDEVGKDGRSMDWAKQMADESDPDDLDENGETITGLVRILRTYREKAPVDAWGFPKLEEIELKRKHKINDLIKKRKMTSLFQYKRQNPENWDDVFLSSDEKSGMDMERLLARELDLKTLFDDKGKKKQRKYFRGNLEWKDNRFDWQDGYWKPEVVLVPNIDGDFWFSWNGLPKDHGCEANATVHSSLRKPGNIDVFCMATDPYDEKDSIEKHPSLGAFAVRILYNQDIDGDKVCKTEADLQTNLELGDPLNYGEDWLTDKYACVYLKREPDPNKFYEAGLKCAIFFGTDNLIEKNKGTAMISKWEQWEFGSYVQDRPEFSKPDSAKGTNTQGIYAVEGTKELYFKLLKTESVKKANTIDIPIVCQQISTLNWKNATKKDLAVGCGWSHVAALRNVRRRIRDKKEEQKQRQQIWEEVSV